MKKGLLIILFAFICLLVVGCGKDKESELITQENDTIKNVESKKKEEYDPTNVNVLKCINKNDNYETINTLEQSKTTYKIVKDSSVTTFKLGKIYTKNYFKILKKDRKENNKSWKIHYETRCDDSILNIVTCDIEVGNDFEKVTMETDPEIRSDVLESNMGLDKDTLSKLKAEYEESGEKCTLS